MKYILMATLSILVAVGCAPANFGISGTASDGVGKSGGLVPGDSCSIDPKSGSIVRSGHQNDCSSDDDSTSDDNDSSSDDNSMSDDHSSSSDDSSHDPEKPPGVVVCKGDDCSELECQPSPQ